ncbi:MAG TPA: uroporphyrinogen-III C-methyltransferase [Stellaceae bacterium]|nr:uroporphyrinogen-III C-methyltransferase [Stellaceae bacterium]
MTDTLLDKLPFDAPEFAPGSVWLAGAGPGDPGLLTLHALSGLARADVVVYDALVGERILSMVRPGCALEYAGKRGGKPSPTQPDITRRLIVLAKEGKRVLRLKGGDPFVFGRGGEEALGLAAAGVPFRIVPGVTAGIGGLAYAGIPVTHRDANSAVAFVTGHDSTGGVPDTVDWAALAKGAPVIVIYMGITHLADIAGKLLAAGRNAGEAVVAVSRATLGDQRVLETTLGEAAREVKRASLETPVIIVVGEVTRLRASLDWFRPA